MSSSTFLAKKNRSVIDQRRGWFWGLGSGWSEIHFGSGLLGSVAATVPARPLGFTERRRGCRWWLVPTFEDAGETVVFR